jgi:hypothetical protein
VCLFGPLPGTPAILSGREGWGEPVAVRRYEAVDGISQDWTIPPEVLSLRVPAGAERMSMMMSERIGVPALLASVAADPDDEDDAEDEDDDDSDGGDDRMEFPGRDE